MALNLFLREINQKLEADGKTNIKQMRVHVFTEVYGTVEKLSYF